MDRLIGQPHADAVSFGGEERIKIWSARSGEAEDGQLLISVSELPGLPPERADQIFNAFFPPNSRHRMGCQSAGPLSNRMTVVCGPPRNAGRGAIFYITLPAISEALNERG